MADLKVDLEQHNAVIEKEDVHVGKGDLAHLAAESGQMATDK